MNLPFIALDTRTGFHLASRDLRKIHVQVNNKDALAVLCSSILLLWRNLIDLDGESRNADAVSAFVVDAPSTSTDAPGVKYFHSQKNVLCVVFGTQRHPLYEVLSCRVAEQVLNGKAAALKRHDEFFSLCTESFNEACRTLCNSLSIANFCVLIRCNLKVFGVCSPHWNSHFPFFDAYLKDEVLPGTMIANELMCSVRASGAVRCVVATWGVALETFEAFEQDWLLVIWAMQFSETWSST